jgi:hypothetical protein
MNFKIYVNHKRVGGGKTFGRLALLQNICIHEKNTKMSSLLNWIGAAT